MLERLCELCSDAIGVEAGPDDSFFELGGSSDEAAYFVTKIRRALGVDVTVLDVFESESLRELEALIVANAESASEAPPPILALDRSQFIER